MKFTEGQRVGFIENYPEINCGTVTFILGENSYMVEFDDGVSGDFAFPEIRPLA